MGCGASAKGPPRPLNEEEKNAVCQIACKEMEVITATHATKSFDQIQIKPPDVVNQFRDNATRCRAAGAEAKDKIADATCGDVAGDIGKKVASGGFLGSMVGAAAAVADKAIDVGAAGAGAAINGALCLLADGMDKAVDAIQKPFTEVGRDIIKAKEKEVTDIFIAYINGWDFPNAFNLVRGGQADAISVALTVAMVQPLAKQLLPIVQAEIDKHAVTKAWDVAIEQTNSMIKTMQEKVPDMMDKYGPKPIELDINIYIVTEVIQQLAVIMGTKEAEVRKDPAGKSRKPKLFEACFSTIELTVEHSADEHAA